MSVSFSATRSSPFLSLWSSVSWARITAHAASNACLIAARWVLNHKKLGSPLCLQARVFMPSVTDACGRTCPRGTVAGRAGRVDIGPTIPIQCPRPSCGRHLATAFADNDSGSPSAPLRALLLQSPPTFNLPTPAGVRMGPILHGGSKRTEEDESVARDSPGTRAYSPVHRY